MLAGLLLITFAALLLPFLVKRVEENLEVFIFVLGLLAAVISQAMSPALLHEALVEPITIALAVLLSSLLFRWCRAFLQDGMQALLRIIPLRVFIFLVVVGLGLLSSIITAIIAALVLVEIVTVLRLDRRTEVAIVVAACFSIGLGAALTPVGEPLSTIVVANLRGAPHHADFWYLARILAGYVVPGVLAMGVLSVFFHGRPAVQGEGLEAGPEQEAAETTYRAAAVRTGKVYLFVMGLIFLGSGLRPLVDRYLIAMPSGWLYWINTVSAILDNATLAAAEVSPRMTVLQIQYALMSLLLAGGMLIPGNIPNIIAAGRLGISSREWARVGVPIGFAVLSVYFVLLHVVG